MNFKIFGDRVLLREAKDEREVGGIYIPESASKAYLMMEVVEVGDGRLRGVDGNIVRTMELEAGQRVMVQVNPMMFQNNAQKIGNEKYLALNYHDIIARIERGVYDLTLAAFHPVGRWVLVLIETPDKVGEIYLPNQDKPMQSAGEIKMFLAKAGGVATEQLGLPVGTRLMLEHARVSPMRIQRVSYAYIDVASVAGAVPGEINLDVLATPAAAGDVVAKV